MKKKDLKSAAAELTGAATSIVIEQPKVHGVVLEIQGTAPLIQNAFGQKAIEQMLRKHMGFSVQRETKKPRELLEQAKIKNQAGRICVPPVAFKLAMLTASTSVKGLKKTQLKTQLYCAGSSVPITYDREIPRMDMVRTAGIGRTPDVRFRPMFEGWRARLQLQFGELVSVQTAVDLLNRAGSVGVGEWRPERNGSFGTFRVVRHISKASEIEEVCDECAVPLVTPEIPPWALDADIDPTVLAKMFDRERSPADDEETVSGRPMTEEELDNEQLASEAEAS